MFLLIAPVDVDAVGLEILLVVRAMSNDKTLGRRWADSRTRDLPAIDEVAHLLAINSSAALVSIAHGDYRLEVLPNLDNNRIAAVLDWELCTLGDPLADLDTSACIGRTLTAMANARTTQRVPEDFSYQQLVEHGSNWS